MDEDTDNNSETGDYFDEGALMAAAAAASEAEGGEQGETDAAAQDAQGEKKTEGQEQPPGLDELRKIAAARAKAQQAQGATQEQPTATQDMPDLAKLAESMSGAEAYKKAVEAAASGDFSQIAKLAGKDEASLYETWTHRALKGDAAAVEAKMAALEAKIAELEGRKLPDDVLTQEKLQEIEARRYAEQARESWKQHVRSPEVAEKYPILHKIDADVALRYGLEADEMLKAAGLPRDFESISRYAESLAREQLGGLLAQQSTGHAQQSTGGSSEAAATSATSGSKRTGVTIDNRAAAETASSLPDITDEAAFIARARRAAEAM